MRFSRPLIIAALLVTASPAIAQEFSLRYTLLDFDFLYQETNSEGIQTDVDINQTISISLKDGAGIGLRGSLQLPVNLFLIGEFSASIVDLTGRVTNPLTDEEISDDFSFRQARLGIGYALPINDNLHITTGVTFDDANFDIGSIVGESFATSDSGIGARLGVRSKLGRNIELDGYVRYTEVGDVDINRRVLESDTLFGGSFLYYVGSAFALGAVAELGEVNSAALTLRFAFGRTRVGR